MSGGDFRVSIPNNARKMIQEIKKTVVSKHTDDFIYTMVKDCNMDPIEASRRLKMIHDIREIAGKHSADDVYTMLKDCNMDPNEAAQRLLYIDTFHEVKKKRDRRKTTNNDGSEEYRQPRGNQWRGARGGRGTYHTSNVSDDIESGRILSSAKVGVTKPSERVRSAMQVHPETENNVAPAANSSTASVNDSAAVSNGSSGRKVATQVSAGVSSSTSGPVVVSSQNSQLSCAVGTIKCEIVKNSSSSEPNSAAPAGIRSGVGQVAAGTIQVTLETTDSDNKTRRPKSDVVDKSQPSDSSQIPLLSSCNSSQTVNSNQDSQPPQLSNEQLKVVTSEPAPAVTADCKPLPGKESEFKASDPKFDVTLEKLTLSSHKPVIFPDHLQVPETLKNQFIFGSLVATSNDSSSVSVTESVQRKSEAVTEPSLSGHNVAATAQEGVFRDHPNVTDSILPSEDNISSDSALKQELSKQEMMAPLGGFQNPLLQTTRDYNLGLMPHLMGPHFVQLDVPELQNGSSVASTTSGATPAAQPAAAGQSSIALSPPLFPYFRQTYPPYFPYSPYFPHMYLPQNAHLLGHGAYPQQPSTGNAYVPSAAAAGVKFPIPTQYKQGSSAGSLAHLGIPSGYGSYASSSAGYGASVNPGSSSASEDLPAPQTKESNMYSAIQQGEDAQVWAPGPGRDIPNLHPNYFYNLPQGQHMAFSPPQAGLYHSSQTMAAQSTVQPLMHQSQSTVGAVESMVPPSSSYQQPQVNWNTALLNRETI